jgi:NAD(P)-dependent dehydrogenase (short-subunit alcohol dehydrogenase family)
MNNWNSSNIPDQEGKVVMITGVSSGLGKQLASVLATKNATIVVAVRNIEKTQRVTDEINKNYPFAKLDIRKLKLDSLNSIKEFVTGFLKDYDRLDILINNAGVMACPFSLTEDGFEIQMGVNHLGHFALTGLLMPLIQKTPNSRIVATSSISHRGGNINFDDINWEKRRYISFQAYGNSKLANLYFAYELARKLESKADVPLVTVAHPGWTKTELQRHSFVFQALGQIFAQKKDKGVLPTLMAAFDPEAKTGNYYGPEGFIELRGNPKVVKSNKISYNTTKVKQLWDSSEKLTGISY